MMNNNDDSLILFEQLASEIIVDIFGYLSSNDIIYGFFDLNQRFNSIVLHRQQILKYIKTPTTDFYLWQNIFKIIGAHIQHFIITTIDFPFSLNLFPNLKSLTISSLLPIECDRLYSILKTEQFNQLISFKIQSQTYYIEKYHQFWAEPIWRNLLNNKNSLQIFECLSYNLPFFYLQTNPNLNPNVNIHSLSLKLVNLIEVLSLLQFTPNVKYLNLFIASPSFSNLSIENKKFPKIKLEKFCLTSSEKRKFILNEESFLGLIIFIKKFSLSLNYLLLNLTGYSIYESDLFHFNGYFLEQQLLKSLIKLKTFHLYVELNEPSINVENLLTTFTNQFWFDHHWTIGIHDKYIYTLPFHFQQLDEFIDFDHIQTNNSMIWNSPQIWYRIRSLDLSEECQLNSNLIEQLKIKMPNLISISPTSISYRHHTDEDEIYETDIKLDCVNTVHFKGEFNVNFQNWLIMILPNLKHLILTKSMNIIRTVYDKIERLTINNREFIFKWDTPAENYFPNVKYVEINLNECTDKDAIRVLNSFRNSKTLTIYFSLDRYRISSPVDTILISMFGTTGLFETLQNYHIKYGNNCLQLINKTN